jgi:hypothetical protein
MTKQEAIDKAKVKAKEVGVDMEVCEKGGDYQVHAEGSWVLDIRDGWDHVTRICKD